MSTEPGAALDPRERQKRDVAAQAAALVESGMVVGLGAGSTAAYAIRNIAERLGDGRLRDVVGVPCSRPVEALARGLGVPLVTLGDRTQVDLTIDGADEVSPTLDLIKGAGGALLREKIVAQASAREVIIVDEAKLSSGLGLLAELPIEVYQFGWRAQEQRLARLGAEVRLRQRDGAPFVTDEGNWILDCRFGPIADPAALARTLDEQAGIAGHGLFLGLATEVLVGSPTGVRRLAR